MIKKQNFNLKRFANYLQFDLLLNGKKYLLFIGALSVFLFIYGFYLIQNQSDFYKEIDNSYAYYFDLSTYQKSFTIAFLLIIVLVVGSSFPELRKTNSSQCFLLLPASIIEKYLVQFIIRIVLPPLLFIVMYWLTFKLATSFYYSIDSWEYIVSIPNFTLFDVFPNDEENWTIFLIFTSIFSLATILFAGTTYFKKNALIKTILLFSCFFFLTITFNVLLSHMFFPYSNNGFDAKLIERKLDNGFVNIEIFISTIIILSNFFFLPIAYFKLKEKQV